MGVDPLDSVSLTAEGARVIALLLRDEQIRDLVSMSDAIPALERTYGEIAHATAVSSPRVDILTPLDSEDPSTPCHELKTMTASMGDYACVRILTNLVRWEERAGQMRKSWLTGTNFSITRGMLLLFKLDTGDLVALLEEGLIRNLRVGATGGVAAAQLARRDTERVGVLGSGFMAKANLQGLAAVRPLQEAYVFSPNPQHREDFAREMTSQLGCSVMGVETPEEAVRECDAAIVSTNAVEPVIDSGCLREGWYITCTKQAELPDQLYRSCDRVFLNHKQNATWQRVIPEGRMPSGDHPAFDAELKRAFPDMHEEFWQSAPDLVDVVSGVVPGRRDDREIICFNNSLGWGLQFLALASLAYERAVEAGVGESIPVGVFRSWLDKAEGKEERRW